MAWQNLSVRAQENCRGGGSNVMIQGMARVSSDKFDLQTNPKGIINLGVAENQLMSKELAAILRPVNAVDPKLFGYSEGPSGSKLLRKHFADNIFNQYFEPHEPVYEDHIVFTAGCSATVDNFTFCVCDPGDGILITTPFYGGFNTDIMAKSKARVIVAHLEDGVSPFGVDQVELMQQAVDQATAEGTRVRAFVLSNPHNPLGRNYPREVLIEFLKFASRNKLHILFDEIYALSVFDYALSGEAKQEQPDQTPFISVLSIPNIEDYCEKELVHVAYGMSKDFCLNGFRCGCLVSPWNKDILEAMNSIAVFTWMSSPIEAMIIKLVENPATIDWFVKTNQRRLAESYTLTVDILRAHRIPFLPAQGGHYIWIDLRQYIPSALVNMAAAGEREAEYMLWKAMLDKGVYLNLGVAFSEKKVGFFRLSFSVPPWLLRIGLERMLRACERTFTLSASL
ncbi:hypothetical protein BGZ65_006216 [Modicella reniformis]|uniref:Aminotransferase class I/classII large domain-containing protein n=1 Tax=Modicella reniformis TaxID=1440133 RepID=A0A9P6ILR6_9FUNG|nr:hypothetical protein BGZ65_006216 [Modicella reniformis]